MGNFRELLVWQKSKDLAVLIYELTDQEKFQRDFAFRNQIRRAAVSVPSNIAEGDQLKTNKHGINHFHIAKGSAAEVMTQLIIAKEINYVSDTVINKVINDYELVSIMLYKLIESRKKGN
jgi:four helix bundle protein